MARVRANNASGGGGGGSKTASGEFTFSSGTVTVNYADDGFEPFTASKLAIQQYNNGSLGTTKMNYIYNSDFNPSKTTAIFSSSGVNYITQDDYPHSETNFTGLVEITSTGFKFRGNNSAYGGTFKYFAIE